LLFTKKNISSNGDSVFQSIINDITLYDTTEIDTSKLIGKKESADTFLLEGSWW